MITASAKPFDARTFTVLGAVLSGLSLPFTGIANHIRQFEPLTRQRHAVMSAHWALGLLFLFFVAWHILLNRRALARHFRSMLDRRRLLHREAFWALGVVTMLLGLAIAHTYLLG